MKYYLLLVIASASLISFSCKHKLPTPITPSPSATTTGSVITFTTPTNKKDSVCYSEEIQPLLSSNCAMEGCHDAISKTEGIDLSTYTGLKKTISGSTLLQVIQDQGSNRMPPSPRARLTNDQINLLKTWVQQGMKQNIDCTGPCDTTNITFAGTIFPIFQNSCIGCHKTDVPVFTDYAQIKVLMDNGKIPCSIAHGTGCSPMPKVGEALSLCKQKQIMKWLAAGSPNN
jgi:hypothetical protein